RSCAPGSVPCCCCLVRHYRAYLRILRVPARYKLGNDWQSPVCRVSAQTPLSKRCKLLWGTPLEQVTSWRRGSESNRRIKVLQTSPLPLGYRALEYKISSLLEDYPTGQFARQVRGLALTGK